MKRLVWLIIAILFVSSSCAITQDEPEASGQSIYLTIIRSEWNDVALAPGEAPPPPVITTQEVKHRETVALDYGELRVDEIQNNSVVVRFKADGIAPRINGGVVSGAMENERYWTTEIKYGEEYMVSTTFADAGIFWTLVFTEQDDYEIPTFEIPEEFSIVVNSGRLAADESDMAAYRQFENLVSLMDENDGILLFSQVTDIIGDNYEEEGFSLRFDLSPLVSLLISTAIFENEDGSLYNDKDIVIGVEVINTPTFLFDETLDVDVELLKSYGEEPSNLSYDHLCSLVGKPGTLIDYLLGRFIYEWGSASIKIRALVDSDENVSYLSVGEMSFREWHSLEEATQEDADKTIALMADMAYKMNENGGYISTEGLIETIEENFDVHISGDYDYWFQFDFWISDDVCIIFRKDDNLVNSFVLSAPQSFLLNEELIIDMEIKTIIDRYSINWSLIPLEERPDIEFFEELFGGSVTISAYRNSSFEYEWLSRNYSVRMNTNPNGEIIRIYIDENGKFR